MAKKLVRPGRQAKLVIGGKGKPRSASTADAHGRSRKPNAKATRAKAVAAPTAPTRPKPRKGSTPKKSVAVETRLATLKERVRRAELRNEPAPTLIESEAVGYLLASPDLMDEVRELAFLELAAVVERKMTESGRPLTRLESANVAWRILGR